MSNYGTRHSTKAKKPPRDPDEWYIEPEDCVEQLFARHRQSIIGPIWDPCAGRGTIRTVAQRFGFETFSTDLRERGFAGVSGGVNFLADNFTFFEIAAPSLIFNPPFGRGKLARAFIRRALERKPRFLAVLLPAPMKFGRASRELFKYTKPAFFHPLVPRPSCPPGKLLVAGEIEAKGGTEDYFWAVWLHDHRPDNPIDEALIGPPRDRRKAKKARAIQKVGAA